MLLVMKSHCNNDIVSNEVAFIHVIMPNNHTFLRTLSSACTYLKIELDVFLQSELVAMQRSFMSTLKKRIHALRLFCCY